MKSNIVPIILLIIVALFIAAMTIISNLIIDDKAKEIAALRIANEELGERLSDCEVIQSNMRIHDTIERALNKEEEE